MSQQSTAVKGRSDPPPANRPEQPDLMFAPYFGWALRSSWEPTMPADPRDRAHALAYFRRRGQRPEWAGRADRADDGRPVTRADLRRAAEERARRQERAEAIQAATLYALLARIAALEGRQRQKGAA